MKEWYILDADHQPQLATWEEYRAWHGDELPRISKRVRRDMLDGPVSISTVFLPMDHGYDAGPPVLFETMVFGGDFDEWQWRYTTWDNAVAGHEAIVAGLKAGTDLETLDIER